MLKNEYNLSDREIEVTVLVLEGYNNQKIAQQIFLSVPTVKTHVSNVFKKTGVQNRFELMSLLKSCATPKENQPELRKPFNTKLWGLFLVVIVTVLAIPVIFRSAHNFASDRSEQAFHRKQQKQEKLFQFSETELLSNYRSIPAGLDPLTISRLFYHIGAVKKDQELWRQLLTNDWSEAAINSTWRMLAKTDTKEEWSYYYLNTAVDEPNEKKYFFQRHCNGIDNGTPRPIWVVKQNGEWRVSFGNP